MLATVAAVIGQKLDKAQQADSVNMLPAFVGEPEKPIRDHLVLAPHKGTHLSLAKESGCIFRGRAAADSREGSRAIIPSPDRQRQASWVR